MICKGSFVLLDFWTYCCIDSVHVLPELKKLEHTFPKSSCSASIRPSSRAGTSPKTFARRLCDIDRASGGERLANEDLEYYSADLAHSCLIDPEGNVRWAASGEREFDEIKAVIDGGCRITARRACLNQRRGQSSRRGKET